MDVMFGVVLFLLAWFLFLLSLLMNDYELPCFFMSLSSFVLFICGGVALMLVTIPYQMLQYTDLGVPASVVITGEQHLASYVPFGYLSVVLSSIPMLWCIVRTFDSIRIWMIRVGLKG